MKIAPLLAVLILTISGLTQGPTWQPVAQGSRSGHGTMVFSAVFSPDSKYLASYDQSGTIVFWELGSRKVIAQIDDTETESFKEPVFSPDGKILAAVVSRQDDPTVLLNETIRFWEVPTGKPIASPVGSFRGIEHLTFSPDSKTLFAEIEMVETAVWDVGTLKRRSLPLPFIGPYSFDSAGTQVAAVTPNNKSVVIVDPTSGRKFKTIPGYGFVASLGFAPGGKYLAVNDEIEGVGMRLKVFNLTTGRMIRGFDEVDSHPPVVFTADGRSAILVQFEKNFAEEPGETTRIGALFDPATGRKQKDLIVNAPINGFGTTFSRDGRFLAVRSSSSITNTVPDSEIRVIDLTTGTVTAALHGYRRSVTSLAFAADGNELLAGYPGGKLVAWSVSGWNPARTLSVGSDDDSAPRFVPGSKYFTLGSILNVFELSTGKEIGDSFKSYQAVSGDGSLMLSADDEQFSFLSVPDQKIRYSFPTAFQWSGLSIALDKTGENFAIGQEGSVDIIESRSGKLISRFRLPKGTISELAYSPDGKYIGLMNSEAESTTSRWTLNVLDALTGKVVFKAPNHDGHFAFSNDGLNIASLNASDKMLFTRVADGRTLMESKVRVLKLGDSVYFAFHPTRPLVAVGTEYGVHVFDTTSGNHVARLR